MSELSDEILKANNLEFNYDMASEPDTGGKTWRNDIKMMGAIYRDAFRKKPHYKAKRDGTGYSTKHCPNGMMIIPYRQGQHYRWLTSNGNIYEYTLKQ